MEAKVVTRFAPSPSGFLHVGGARTAIFNFLFSRKNKGIFRLRIEDTDKARSNEEMIDKIIKGLTWLGIDYDGDIVFQGKNMARHREIAEHLIESGWAYRCFCSKEILMEKRKNSDIQGITYRYDQTCRYLTDTQVEHYMAADIPSVIRLKIPLGETSWQDAVRGKIAVKNQELDDFITLRSDGSPTYQLSVVVDDFDMGITHVIRGEDHISNTPKQLLLYQACGWPIPQFSHVPLILGSDKKRLSKRHGANSVEDYQKRGILPDALFNYLSLLGWTPEIAREILSQEQLIKQFTLEGINKKSAIFDESKLRWMNRQYISQRDTQLLFPEVTHLWMDAGLLTKGEREENRDNLLKIITLMKYRVENMSDFVLSTQYFFQDPSSYEEKGLKKYLKNPNVWDWISNLMIRLNRSTSFKDTELERIIRQFAKKIGVTAAKLIHPLRLALCGISASPGLFEVMEILGKETVIRRLNRFLEQKYYLQKDISN